MVDKNKEELNEENEDQTKEMNETDQNENEPVNDKMDSVEENESSNANESDERLLELHKDVERLSQEKNDIYERLLRVQAEYDNFKKRTQKEKEAERKYKAQDIVNELLPAIDNFERALKVEVSEEAKSFVEGMSMVYRQLIEALKSQGVVEIESVGKEFDPTIHHAVMQVEDENSDSNIVVEELQKGYLLKDRVIRPAMVKVNK